MPIPQSGALGTTNVEYKQYGIKLSIIPVVDANNIISAHLTTEISQIDPTVSYGGMPGFLTRNTSSDISMRAGETLAISGLFSADAVNDSNGMPFLGQLPIIGQLFRSDSFRAKKSDLVIFVTPVISDPELAPNTDLLARRPTEWIRDIARSMATRIRLSQIKIRRLLCLPHVSGSNPHLRSFLRRFAVHRRKRQLESKPPRPRLFHVNRRSKPRPSQPAKPQLNPHRRNRQSARGPPASPRPCNC